MFYSYSLGVHVSDSIVGNFGEVLIWWLGEFGKDCQIKKKKLTNLE